MELPGKFHWTFSELEEVGVTERIIGATGASAGEVISIIVPILKYRAKIYKHTNTIIRK